MVVRALHVVTFLSLFMLSAASATVSDVERCMLCSWGDECATDDWVSRQKDICTDTFPTTKEMFFMFFFSHDVTRQNVFFFAG